MFYVLIFNVFSVLFFGTFILARYTFVFVTCTRLGFGHNLLFLLGLPGFYWEYSGFVTLVLFDYPRFVGVYVVVCGGWFVALSFIPQRSPNEVGTAPC